MNIIYMAMTPSSSFRLAVGVREKSALSDGPLDMVGILARAHHPGAGAEWGSNT